MATVTGLTAARMQQVIDAQMATADIVGDDLVITTNDGHAVNAGDVRGPMGSITGYPNLFDPCACRYRKLTGVGSTLIADPSGGFGSLPVAWDTAVYAEVGSNFSLDGSGNIVVAEAGIYHVSCSLNFGINPSVAIAQFTGVVFVDTTPVLQSPPSFVRSSDNAILGAGYLAGVNMNGDVKCSAGSLIKVTYSYTNSHNVEGSGAGNTAISVHRVA